MAELTQPGERLGGSRLARQQLLAIAWLRWRILANSFRRKGGAGELIARILLFPLFGIVALLPVGAAGMLAWYFTSIRHMESLVWIFWGAIVLTQLVNINLGQPGTTFDPVELIRFPMPLRRFVLVRLCFGLLGPANIIVSLISFAVVVGLTIADASLFLPALLTMTTFAVTNVLFTRMVFAWVDRWLSTRRAREIFTALVFVLSLLIQYVNVRFNPGLQPHRQHQAPLHSPGTRRLELLAHQLHPFVRWLPPELTTHAIRSAAERHFVPWLVYTAATSLFAVVFLFVYSLRMRTEFRGENLSDAAIATPRVAPQASSAAPSPAVPILAMQAVRRPPRLLPASLLPLLSKELLVLRRNVGLFYGLIAPAVMIFLFAGRLSARSGSHWVLLGAVAYALLGIAPMSYNAFGYEGTGAQLYFFAPLRLREVFFAKNVFGLLLALVEVVIVVSITAYAAGAPQLADCVFALLWATGTVLLNTTLGNLRSVSAPKRVSPGRTMGKAQSAVSGYIAMGILAGCAALGFGAEVLAIYLKLAWVGILLMTLFAAAGVAVYVQGLRGIESYALQRRDTLFEELGKKT